MDARVTQLELFFAADKLRKNLEPSDYKHIVLGLIFLKQDEPTLRVIAHELVISIKNSVSVDWMHREATRARMRVLVKLAPLIIQQKNRGRATRPGRVRDHLIARRCMKITQTAPKAQRATLGEGFNRAVRQATS